MAATIKDVAQQCGIDPSVVRRVLHAHLGDISDEVRKTVEESAEALGLAPSCHPPTLGILYAEESGKGLTHPFFSLILNVFKAEAEAKGYDITFINPGAKDMEGSYARHCRYSGVDGICMVCVDFLAPEIKDLIDEGIPCLTIDHIFRGVPAVLSDNETGVQKLVEYAISMGHRRIAFIHGHNNSIVTRTRMRQFENTMAYHNLEVPPEFLCDGLYHDISLTRETVLRLLRLPERPTCILLPDDLTYFGAQEAALELDMRIPEDISFAGYDGIPLTQMLTPRLTTIHQSSDTIGHVAARRLIDLIENPDIASKKPIIYPVELVEGGTLANLNDGEAQ